ncbi:Pycsar system effector family protein [Methylopila sp. M107]|uniref:Pycsar system effector family protein n=1 Tax=Methylopila sp. M107 TaxID=1101190 RepID=UPI00037391AB|nr:Pycsar system effector family protein [Methylopila sp. M107]
MSDGNPGFAYIKALNDTFYDQIKVADQKATLMISLIVLMIVWSPDVRQIYLQPFGVADGGWLPAAVVTVALVVALVSALCVVAPRTRKSRSPLFWGGWPEAGDAAIALAIEGDREKLLRSYAENAAHLAVICRRKYLFVSIAVWALIVALVAHGVFVTIR